tara:strand:+ start:1170 stop:1559 length:390 start_codon:yes stop_codon:yes gene_type:complete
MIEKKQIITERAPQTIGAYSQAIKCGNLIFISGQIPLVPETMKLISQDFELQVNQVLVNLMSIANEAGCDSTNFVKLTVYLKSLENFSSVNKAMESVFVKPYPARAAVEVSKLPLDVEVEMDAILVDGS